ncbi:MAG: hypothetical protein ACLFTT_14620 [Candidatus Hydrogenedentota bacterium]
MRWINDLFKSRARRAADQARARNRAIAKARTALRRERRAITKRQSRSEELRTAAVEHERAGRPGLAKQKVRRFVQMDKEVLARNLALDNMEHVLEQAQTTDNYEGFVRAMEVVANIEELAQQGVDPDTVRERLAGLAERNQDLMEPWMESDGPVATAALPASVQLNVEEEDAYAQIMGDAAGSIAAENPQAEGSVFAKMDADLEQKMSEALNRG